MKYLAVKGSTLTDAQASVVGRRLAEIDRRGGRSITPDAVVADARSAESPLHLFFEWDDAAAAEAHRIERARYLIRSVRVVIEKEGREPFTPRAFVRAGTEGAEYKRVQVVLAQPDLREDLLRRALDELRAWRRRYADLKELAEVFAAVDRTAA